MIPRKYMKKSMSFTLVISVLERLKTGRRILDAQWPACLVISVSSRPDEGTPVSKIKNDNLMLTSVLCMLTHTHARACARKQFDNKAVGCTDSNHAAAVAIGISCEISPLIEDRCQPQIVLDCSDRGLN